MGFDSIELEGDAREVVLVLERAEVCEAAFGSIIMETRLLLQSFEFYSVTHIRREGSRAAHCLAKFALAHKCHHVWIDVCPSFILEVVCYEQVV